MRLIVLIVCAGVAVQIQAAGKENEPRVLVSDSPTSCTSRPSCPKNESQSTAPELRGIVLPLYAADPTFNYRFALEEIAATGANTVSLAVVLLQDNARSTEIVAKPGRTVPDDVLRRTMRQARAAGLDVMLFPIVLLDKPDDDDWRGNLKPTSMDAWFASYRHWVLHYAAIAREEHAAWMSIGSEFASLESETARWRALIADVRDAFDSKLLYSVNWDHLEGPEGWWDALDAVGLSSYYELTDDPEASQAELDAAWRDWRDWILDWRREAGVELPLIFTEVGYPSMDGAAVYPWDYTLDNPVDLDEQRRCFQAFIAAWAGRPEAEGVFFYKWLGFDADEMLGYSPRGKPAEHLIRAWYGETMSPSP